MSDNEEYEEEMTPTEDNPVRGQLKMLRIRKNGVDHIELRIWSGTDWLDFDDYLIPGDDEE